MKRVLVLLTLCIVAGAVVGAALGRWGGLAPVTVPQADDQAAEASIPSGDPVPAAGDAAEGEGGQERVSATDAAVAASNAFACDLYRELTRAGGNLFFSPYSLFSALAMVYGGAGGETAAQLARALHVAGDSEDFHRSMAALAEALNAPDKAYDLSVASALWGQSGYAFLPDFLELTDRYYGARLHEVDYTSEESREETRETINRWVEQETRGRIRDLIQPEDLSALTRLVLTNAIYFKGAWELAFDPEATRPMPFHLMTGETAEVPMMHQVSRFLYAENAMAQLLELPYAGGDLSMVVLLPREGALDELESKLDPETVGSWLAAASRQEVEVFIPRFTLEQRVVLNDVLQGLGVVDAFDQQRADFSGMSEDRDLHISRVIHQTFVEVNEEGTEAAGATGVGMRTTSLPLNPPPVFRADRPFVFMIRDGETGTILFLGRVTDPRG